MHEINKTWITRLVCGIKIIWRNQIRDKFRNKSETGSFEFVFIFNSHRSCGKRRYLIGFSFGMKTLLASGNFLFCLFPKRLILTSRKIIALHVANWLNVKTQKTFLLPVIFPRIWISIWETSNCLHREIIMKFHTI